MPLSLSLSLTDASGADRRRISLPGLAAGLAWPGLTGARCVSVLFTDVDVLHAWTAC